MAADRRGRAGIVVLVVAVAGVVAAARARAGGVRPGRALGELLTAAERVAAVSGIEDVEALVEAVKEAGLWPAAAAAVAPGEEEGGARKRAR